MAGGCESANPGTLQCLLSLHSSRTVPTPLLYISNRTLQWLWYSISALPMAAASPWWFTNPPGGTFAETSPWGGWWVGSMWTTSNGTFPDTSWQAKVAIASDLYSSISFMRWLSYETPQRECGMILLKCLSISDQNFIRRDSEAAICFSKIRFGRSTTSTKCFLTKQQNRERVWEDEFLEVMNWGGAGGGANFLYKQVLV